MPPPSSASALRRRVAPLDPEEDVEALEASRADIYEQDAETPFVEMFRNSAPYISMHRGSVMVLHIPGDIMGTVAFERTLDDVALMSLLGVKICIVCGVAAQVDRRLRELNVTPRYCGDVRITDNDTLRIVKEEAGFARCEIESALSRGFKGRPGAMGINVVGGNMFYSAKPFGVIEGVDFGFTGEVRKVETEQLLRRLDQGDVVLLTTLGYSASGQVFNVVSEHLASECASALSASKLIFITEGQTLVDTRSNSVIQSMRLRDAKALLGHHNVTLYPTSVAEECLVGGVPVLSEQRASANSHKASILRFCRYSVQALLKGVRRAHLVPPGNGRLLQELYTRDGAGTLISRDLYDGIRPATVADVPSIMDIIQPLIDDGVLTVRSKSQMEKDISQYYVFTRDNLTVACGQLRKFGKCAEIGCLAVDPGYRRGGRGDAMLGYLERIAVNSGLTTIFVLSTRTMQWFLERGFNEVAVEALPPERVEIYNWKRKSKIYMKKLKTARDLDAEELFWNV